jgi:anti-anti-sigma regulatory factor
LGNVSLIDSYGKESLIAGMKAVRKNNGRGLICNSNLKFNDNFKIVDNELSALKIITI